MAETERPPWATVHAVLGRAVARRVVAATMAQSVAQLPLYKQRDELLGGDISTNGTRISDNRSVAQAAEQLPGTGMVVRVVS